MTRKQASDDRQDALPMVSRRTTLRAAGAAAVGAVTALAGCATGGAEPDGTPADIETGSTDESTETDAPEETETETAEPTETATETETSSVDWESWFAPTDNHDGFEDHTGESEVTVMVGADGIEGPHAFEPTAIHVSPGTTVVWEWTGGGGTHDVVDEAGAFKSELVADEGHTFEQTFDEVGATQYFCTPHKAMGMRGGIIVEE
ncbi:hypothetical protein AUR64_04680 [Haloprofundus marisrubri]|uniref:Blue (type 1) copper domain-containing protein n=1 Tax=Haloprofundus marisrubri TaxID=1514971 RepID=A0A0W1RDU8_9EURY|nr:halocyanin domain-containing protein [Haloprofundus marisrubri]KTG11226.1 hypothetical protein AUR64_04680 [Haloprofundus marisrubri]